MLASQYSGQLYANVSVIEESPLSFKLWMIQKISELLVYSPKADPKRFNDSVITYSICSCVLFVKTSGGKSRSWLSATYLQRNNQQVTITVRAVTKS